MHGTRAGSSDGESASFTPMGQGSTTVQLVRRVVDSALLLRGAHPRPPEAASEALSTAGAIRDSDDDSIDMRSEPRATLLPVVWMTCSLDRRVAYPRLVSFRADLHLPGPDAGVAVHPWDACDRERCPGPAGTPSRMDPPTVSAALSQSASSWRVSRICREVSSRDGRRTAAIGVVSARPVSTSQR
jgi:hypothetical protein